MLAEAGMSAAELHAAAERIKSLRQKATEHAVEIGRELLRVKASLPHGAFVTWVKNACEFKIRTAQDLMKLAHRAESDGQLVALMLPSTLRVYLAKTTPPAAQHVILSRLKNGERVSRKELRSVVSAAKLREAVRREPVSKATDRRRSVVPDLLATETPASDSDGDRSRKIAHLLIQRLNEEDYEVIMDGMTWAVWNRVYVWLRAARRTAPEIQSRQALTRSGASLSMVNCQ